MRNPNIPIDFSKVLNVKHILTFAIILVVSQYAISRIRKDYIDQETNEIKSKFIWQK